MIFALCAVLFYTLARTERAISRKFLRGFDRGRIFDPERRSAIKPRKALRWGVFGDMARELKAISDFYDFMLWLIRHTEKFQRHHRYNLGLGMENRLQTILELLLRAKYSKSKKAETLRQANLELEVLRFQLRLAHENT